MVGRCSLVDMARFVAVPEELLYGPFRGSDAVRRGLLTRRQLQGASWRRVMRDVYVHRSIADTSQLRRAALRLAQPSGTFACGRTAAWFHGAWHPPPGMAVPLESSHHLLGSGRAPDQQARRRLTLRVFGLEDEVEEVDGIAVLSARRTCFDLMRERNLVEAVVVADAFAAAGAILIPEFFAYADAHCQWPGVRQVRLALTFATRYSLSCGETRLRMIVVLSGFPEPLVNPPFWAGWPPGLLGHPDILLIYVPRPAGLEYDGASHEELAVHRIDLNRENRLVTRGQLPILRYEKYGVVHRRDAIAVEVAECTGFPPSLLQPLDPRDFWLPNEPLRW